MSSKITWFWLARKFVGPSYEDKWQLIMTIHTCNSLHELPTEKHTASFKNVDLQILQVITLASQVKTEVSGAFQDDIPMYHYCSKKSLGSVFPCSWKRSSSSSIFSLRLLDWSSKVWICVLDWSWLWSWSELGCPMVTSWSANTGPGELNSGPHSHKQNNIRLLKQLKTRPHIHSTTTTETTDRWSE